jgi:hypothetical protein
VAVTWRTPKTICLHPRATKNFQAHPSLRANLWIQDKEPTEEPQAKDLSEILAKYTRRVLQGRQRQQRAFVSDSRAKLTKTKWQPAPSMCALAH